MIVPNRVTIKLLTKSATSLKACQEWQSICCETGMRQSEKRYTFTIALYLSEIEYLNKTYVSQLELLNEIYTIYWYRS